MISPPAILARRFVAGETAAEAIKAGQRLYARGIDATFDLLGEDVLDREAARRSAEANEHLLRLIPSEVERNISIKLTMMGLDISEDFCLELTGILDTARSVGASCASTWRDRSTQRTIDAFRRRAARQRGHRPPGLPPSHGGRREGGRGPRRPGPAVQRRLQGAAEIAWTSMGRHPGELPPLRPPAARRRALSAIATHDEGLVQDTIAYAREAKIGPGASSSRCSMA